jgi:hypothetical protein
VRPAWHELLAPLPADAVVRRAPVAGAELTSGAHASAIAGWESITLELSAGADGLRHLMVTVDASGAPVSAGDWVLYCSGKPLQYLHENIGGRIQPDGSFLGTRWRSVAVEVPGSDEPERRETTQSEPTEQEIAGLMRLVRQLLNSGSGSKLG